MLPPLQLSRADWPFLVGALVFGLGWGLGLGTGLAGPFQSPARAKQMAGL